jgi:thioredoxin 1
MELTKDNFEQTNSGLHFVKYSAEWCGPCKQMTPIINELSKNYTNISFDEVDVDKENELAVKFNIRGVPTFMLIKDGSVVETLVGSQTRSKLVDVLNKYAN